MQDRQFQRVLRLRASIEPPLVPLPVPIPGLNVHNANPKIDPTALVLNDLNAVPLLQQDHRRQQHVPIRAILLRLLPTMVRHESMGILLPVQFRL